MNPARGEAEVAGFHLRPSFAALVAAEGEVGPLFALVDRAAGGALSLADMVALFWHCRAGAAQDVARAEFAEAVTAAGLAAATPALKILLGQILQGR
jgi:hypothetical protein